MFKKLLIMFAIIFTTFTYAQAVHLDDAGALDGLETVGAVVDLNQGNADTLLTRLKLIKLTYTQISSTGTPTKFVVAIRGGASKYMTRNNNYIPEDKISVKEEIYDLIRELKRMGVEIYQCGVALGFLKVGPEEIVPEITVVRNGYITLIAYQNKGYALLPME